MQLPTWSPSKPLIHIGTLRAEDKCASGDSFEGHGLSVSECPDAWEAIARLGGSPRWRLQCVSRTPEFMDWHATSQEQRADILEWGISKGLVELCTVHRVYEHDSERGEFRCMSFSDANAAQEEFDFLAAEHIGKPDTAPRLERHDGHQLTARGLERVMRRAASPDEAAELCAVLYVEECAQVLCGVYWSDRLEPENLSAPRAVIVPGWLQKFEATKLDAPAPRRRVGMR